jgi:hypothetical protein
VPTYLQLGSEPEWGAQYVPPAMETELLRPLRAFFNLGPALIGAPGDNNHLYGRHRSYEWAVSSRFCTDRTYGTTDRRDQGGDRNWYRGFDVGITGQPLYDASRRMDQLVRSGKAPGVAEWFGTYDGRTVVGWFEGRPSSSDTSHLWHLHGGVWNEAANDPALMKLLYLTITGQTTEEEPMLEIPRDSTGTMWVSSDRITRRRLVTDNDVRYYLGRGALVPYSPGVADNGAPCVENILEFGVDIDPIDDPRPPLVLSEADLDEIRKAAAAGAAAGSSGPSLAEIEQVVDKELDEQARAGADTD